jgi:hypothetical protein
MTQLRTEKIGLRAFLADRGIPEAEDGSCQCRGGRQTVYHTLFICKKLRTLREEILGQAQPIPDLTKWLTQAKPATRAAKFILDSKLLGQYGATYGQRD